MLRILIAAILAATAFLPTTAVAACTTETDTVWTPTGQRIDVQTQECVDGAFFADRVRFGFHDNVTAAHAGGSVWAGEGSLPHGGSPARAVGAGGDAIVWRDGPDQPRAVLIWGFHAYDTQGGCALDALVASQTWGPSGRLLWYEDHERCPTLP